jgi:hypothetical protein
LSYASLHRVLLKLSINNASPVFIRAHVAPILSVSSYQSWRLTEGFIGALTLVSWFLVRRLPLSTIIYDIYRSPGTSPVIGTSNGQRSNGNTSRPQNGRSNGTMTSISSVADTPSQARARSMNPFEPLSLLKLDSVVPLVWPLLPLKPNSLTLINWWLVW